MITKASWQHMTIIQEQGTLPAQQGWDVLQVFIMILADFELCAHFHNLTSAVDSTGFKCLDKTISLHDFLLQPVLWRAWSNMVFDQQHGFVHSFQGFCSKCYVYILYFSHGFFSLVRYGCKGPKTILTVDPISSKHELMEVD